MNCEKCKIRATKMNLEYHKDIWLCTYHSNKAVKQGRINKKINKSKSNKQTN